MTDQSVTSSMMLECNFKEAPLFQSLPLDLVHTFETGFGEKLLIHPNVLSKTHQEICASSSPTGAM
jgi:hypothetical protein